MFPASRYRRNDRLEAGSTGLVSRVDPRRPGCFASESPEGVGNFPMLDRRFSVVAPRPWCSPRLILTAHLAVIGAATLALIRWDFWWVEVVGALAAGTSLFALAGLVDEPRAPDPRRGWSEALGMLAGWTGLTPRNGRRAFEAAHHLAPNELSDPRALLNSRWMIVVGTACEVFLIHRHAVRTLRGRALVGYMIETGGMVVTLGVIVWCLPLSVVARACLLPCVVAALGRNGRIVVAHLDRPAGRFLDTWQLALPAPVSRWLLHADHHLEHHLRPDLRWDQRPVYRAEIVRGGFIPRDQQVTALGFARVVFSRRRPVDGSGATADLPPVARRWAGRAAIRARPRQPNHPTRGSVG